jgi:nuclear protein localization family protein 4
MPAKPTFPVEYLFVSITHGFPNAPDPLFLSTTFPVENRGLLDDQSMVEVVRNLMRILQSSDLDVSDTSTWPSRIKNEVGKWLSDWHLVTFLAMHGPFSTEEQKLVGMVATAHRHPEHAAALEQLFATPGWQTLLTIAESTGAARQDTTAAQFNRMGIDSPSTGSPGAGASIGSAFNTAPGTGVTTPAVPDDSFGAAAGGGGGEKACPHCTYINEAGASDCDVCGLPL